MSICIYLFYSENQDLQDDGFEALCTNNSLNNLKEIRLNDNNASVVGVSHLINNKWPQDVTYKLDTVRTKDGFAFNVGQSISVIKGIVKTETSELKSQ